MPIDLRKTVNLDKKVVAFNNLDLVGALDISYSMNGPEGNGTRYSVGVDAFTDLLGAVCKYDPDGADFLFFDDKLEKNTGVTPDGFKKLAAKYGPRGGTKLAPPLQYMFDKYLLAPKAYKPVQKQVTTGGLFGFGGKTTTVTEQVEDGYVRTSPKRQVCGLFYTDGEPQDGNEVAKAIVDATHRIAKDNDLGILIVQVGNNREAKLYLERLNNQLTDEGASFDCVAVCNIEDLIYSRFTPEEIIKLAFNG